MITREEDRYAVVQFRRILLDPPAVELPPESEQLHDLRQMRFGCNEATSTQMRTLSEFASEHTYGNCEIMASVSSLAFSRRMPLEPSLHSAWNHQFKPARLPPLRVARDSAREILRVYVELAR